MPIISGGGASVLPSTLAGYEIGYDQTTTAISGITATTEGTAQAFITCAAHTFDGGAVIADFYCCTCTAPTASNLFVGLFETGTLIERLSQITSPAGAQVAVQLRGGCRFTPTLGSHSYVIGVWVGSTTGSPSIWADTGGPTKISPAWVRFTKA